MSLQNVLLGILGVYYWFPSFFMLLFPLHNQMYKFLRASPHLKLWMVTPAKIYFMLKRAKKTRDHVVGNSGQGMYWQGSDKNPPTG